jgi:hypothetical protein
MARFHLRIHSTPDRSDLRPEARTRLAAKVEILVSRAGAG